jgi:hypothetical protein
MRRLIAVLTLILAVLIVTPTEAQGRFWVLVNGSLRYTGIVSVGVLQFGGTSDTGISRISAGNIGIGNGTSGDVSGGASMAALTLSGAGSILFTGKGFISAPTAAGLVLQNSGLTAGNTLKIDAAPTVSACGAGSPAVTAGSTFGPEAQAATKSPRAARAGKCRRRKDMGVALSNAAKGGNSFRNSLARRLLCAYAPLMKYAFLGGGKMAGAFIRGMLRAKLCAPADITVSDHFAPGLEALAAATSGLHR